MGDRMNMILISATEKKFVTASEAQALKDANTPDIKIIAAGGVVFYQG
jgi:hypothetical protein